MKRIILTSFLSLILVFGISTAFDVPGSDGDGGSDFDTTEIDQLLVEIEELNKTIDELNTDLEKSQGVVDTVAVSHNLEQSLEDVESIREIKTIKDELTSEEVQKLKESYESISDLPAEYEGIIDQTKDILEQIPDMITDLTGQISDDPMKAGGLKDLKDKLNTAKENLTEAQNDLQEVLLRTQALVETLTTLTK